MSPCRMPLRTASIALIGLTVTGALALPGQAGTQRGGRADTWARTPQAAAPKADFDAAFVGMKVPQAVHAHEVFRVSITLRNTGAEPWWCESVRLRSVEPENNTTWGTSFIIMAQGTSTAPGKECTFRSYLKAPPAAGKATFAWQLVKDGKLWFGEKTAARTLRVLPRRARPTATAPSPVRVPRGRAGKKPLTFADFEYVGSFKPPKTVGKARGAFSESGLALRRMPDGTKRLLMNYTHPSQVLFEVEIPPPVKIDSGRHGVLKVARVRKVWGSIRMPREGDEAIRPNGNFVWDDRTDTLYWTSYHGYKTGRAPPVLGACKLADDGRIRYWGPWYVRKPLYKAYWGGVIRLPKAFADKYTGGRTLALGFGGYYSICGPASRGPALGAIPKPNPASRTVDVLEMLVHPHGKPAPRDGDYLNANCGFWADQPEGPGKGYWTYDDCCRAGAFIETATRQAYVAFVQLGTGRMGYDFGAINSAGHVQYWYFYDGDELGRAAKGARKPSGILPCSMTKVAYPLGSLPTGACYDEQERRLYLCTKWAYNDGERESYPCVHVYRVRQ